MKSDQNDSSRLQIPPEPTGPSENATSLRSFLKKYYQQIIGFLGWYVVNGIFWLLKLEGKPVSYYPENAFFLIITLPVNLLILIILAAIKWTRPIAFGILLAMAVNFVIDLILGNFFAGACLLPFFLDMGR